MAEMKNKKTKVEKAIGALDRGDLKYGNVEIEADEFSVGKIRITTFIDEDIYIALKKRATKDRAKYQTLLNDLLRDQLFPPKKKLDVLIKEVRKAMDTLENENLEELRKSAS